MQKKIINSIQKDYIKKSGAKISKIEIEKYLMPIFDYINFSKKNTFILSGSQGIGKTTLIKILEKNFEKYYKKKILTLSLDDFYFNKKERLQLSNSIHPLLITRGVPGTHNINEIFEIIKKFKKNQYPLKIPLFDKLTDRRKRNKKIVKKKADILIFEGWCCGCPPINKNYLYKNINFIEKKYDKNYLWRNYYNNLLIKEYSRMFKKFDKMIYLKPPSFKQILKWRTKQEKDLLKKSKKIKKGMNMKQIAVFIQHYEKITKWMIKTLPKKADLTVYVNKNQRIKKISSV